MTSVLDWIGYSVDIASLKSFFSQRASVTVCAVWEGLNSTARKRSHRTAFNVLLTVHMSIMDHAPWEIGRSSASFSSIVALAPSFTAALMNTYPCSQSELDRELLYAINGHAPTEVMKQLLIAGAALKNEKFRTCLDGLIRTFGSRECDADDMAVLETLLEAGSVVDEIPGDANTLGWKGPNEPHYTTDYLLLRHRQSTRRDCLCTLVSRYSDRQQDTLTVPGIFEAAHGGQEPLRSYLNARSKPHDDQYRKVVMELALSEASGRGYFDVVQSLVHFGVDPNVRMLLQHKPSRHAWRLMEWHPVIRAANTGAVDTLRLLTTTTSIDVTSLDDGMWFKCQLDLCALRSRKGYQRDQILGLLSAFGFPTSFRSLILLNALHPYKCDNGHDGPDFGFVSQLLELGVACIDGGEHPNDDTPPPILVRAVMTGCDVRTMAYLVERDEEVVSGLSAGTMTALFKATLQRTRGQYEMLEFFAENFEGFRSHIQENGTSLLLYLAERLSCGGSHGHADRYGECEAMVTVKWLLSLGATLATSFLTKLVSHADDSFMLEWIRSVADADADDIYQALQRSISIDRLNLAVALIEKGGPVNNPPGWTSRNTALQDACERDAPLWFIEFLVDKGADVNAPPASIGGRTALQAACTGGAQLSSISFLINRGADVNAPADPMGGLTALQHAASRGSMNVVGLLLDHGADVNAISGYIWDDHLYRRSLDLAAGHSRLDMVQFLIAAGARSGRPGRTAFEGAVEIATLNRNLAIARLLTEHSDSHSGDPMEAERGWLRENPHACMYKGGIQGAVWVNFVKQSGGENEQDFRRHIAKLLPSWV